VLHCTLYKVGITFFCMFSIYYELTFVHNVHNLFQFDHMIAVKNHIDTFAYLHWRKDDTAQDVSARGRFSARCFSADVSARGSFCAFISRTYVTKHVRHKTYKVSYF